jgi:heme exporter protein A
VNAPPPLAVVDVSRRFGRSWALRRVSLTFPQGTATALLGDNGAGKSTLLQICAGLQRPTEGHVEIHGVALRGFFPAESRAEIAYLGHLPFVYPDLTGRENLAFFRRLFGVEGTTTDATLLERVGLTHAADRPARTYSRGMTQRLALARMILQDAPIWLLDEPTTGLDAHGLALLRKVLADATARGRTLIAVTHDLESLGPMTRTVRLHGGRLQASPEASPQAPSEGARP